MDGKKVSTQRTNYNIWNGVALPQNIQTAKKAESLDNRIEYLSYDTQGNPLEVKQSGGIPMLYVWGYKEQYPIAKISNASYTGMPAAVRAIINQLQASSYTYDPLIGGTSVTDPRGYTMYYHYDDFNRLKFVKDADGNLVSEHQYGYKK